MKRVLFTIRSLLLSLLFLTTTAHAQNIELTLNGEPFEFHCSNIEPADFIIDNVTYKIPDICVGAYEVDQALWQRIMKTNPSHFKSNPKNPVENISYSDVMNFITKLNAATGAKFRLLTHTEWLYIAQNDIAKLNIDNENIICESFNLYDNSSKRINSFGNKSFDCDDTYPYTAPVDSSIPNKYGIYNMLGNVSEWGLDSADNGVERHRNHEYYTALKDVKSRVVLGGSFSDGPNEMKTLFNTRRVNTKFGGLGVRLVLDNKYKRTN